jgi:hypothetical protein
MEDDVLEELFLYIKYVNAQESTLSSIEQQKEEYRNTYFSKDIKDKDTIHNSLAAEK